LKNLLKEFRPALLFLGKFLVFYFVGNILYGLFVESYGHSPDAVTRVVTNQSAWLLNVIGYSVTEEDHTSEPKIALKQHQHVVLYIFEGCNSVNVIIVFLSFLFAYGGSLRKLAVFLPLGLLTIHVFNLLRLDLLFYMAWSNSSQFYYFHKYFFTAILYLVVFALWTVWVIWSNEIRNSNAAA
jgi:exosortase family protein XrtF